MVVVPSTSSQVSASDLRAAIARSHQYIYVVAAKAKINPISLSRILNGRTKITERTAARILRAIDELHKDQA